ncbi:GGDEF domain-containing protein [Paenibacillus sp. y28]|uniref:GGDEF domain-containing protein n=1 Tax=Paenibacillus sp. y28 TaxID=3129110 RepID=UPI003017F29A
MFHVKLNQGDWTRHVARQMQLGEVGLIYVDIIRLGELKAAEGRAYGQQILRALQQLMTGIDEEFPAVFHKNKMGDDFFLFARLGPGDLSSCIDMLHHLSMRIKLHLEQHLNRLFPRSIPLGLYVGSAVLVGSAGRELDAIVYSAMKQAIGEAKHWEHNREHMLKQKEFDGILNREEIRTVYQPIISLEDSAVFGYEALTRGPSGSIFQSPVALFDFAAEEDCLYRLDKLAREKAIAGFHRQKDQKIFINIPAQVIHDSEFTPGNTQKLLQQFGLQPSNVVFEITERSSIEDFTTTKKILQHYRSQGYQIAIDDAGAGYSSLQAIAELQPDYIKVDRSLITNIHQDRMKETILDTFVSFARKMNISIVAEGIEHPEELFKLIRMGVHYAQGYLLGRPSDTFGLLDSGLEEQIDLQRRIGLLTGGTWCVGDLVNSAVSFDEAAPVSEVSNYFRRNENETGCVIVRDEMPVGMVMKEKLFQQLSAQYGLPLFWSRPIAQIMDKQPLIVDESKPVELVSQLAMGREHAKLYDFVIVTKQGKLSGIATVRSILEWITNVRMESAKVASPLTGLPGNLEIHRQLNKRLKGGQPFSVIYADLDYFKWYNDQYGFQKGDQVIQFTADILQHGSALCGHPNDFLGHIGGDDFIILTDAAEPQHLCQEVIRRFDHGVTSFYEGEEVKFVEDRFGNRIDHSGVSISLSLVVCQYASGLTAEQITGAAAQLKKEAKRQKGSIWMEHRFEIEASHAADT